MGGSTVEALQREGGMDEGRETGRKGWMEGMSYGGREGG